MSEAPNMPKRIWMGSLVNGGEGKSYVRDDIHHADVHAAVKRAIEACADKCADRAAYIEDCIKWGGTKTYPTSLKGRIIELSNTGSAIRAIAADPEAIAKIIGGGE